jgi:hypothetical protein
MDDDAGDYEAHVEQDDAVRDDGSNQLQQYEDNREDKE